MKVGRCRHINESGSTVSFPPLVDQYSTLIPLPTQQPSILTLSQEISTKIDSNSTLTPSILKLSQGVTKTANDLSSSQSTMSQSPIHTTFSLPHINAEFVSSHVGLPKMEKTQSSRRQRQNTQRNINRTTTKRSLHRYISLPACPSKDSVINELGESQDILGHSLNSRLQKVVQQSPRQIYSRFELIEDRFLAHQSQNEAQTPRAKQPHVTQVIPKPHPSKEPVHGWSGLMTRLQEKVGTRMYFKHEYMEPLVRFRKAIRLIILLLRAIYTTKERIERQEKERKLSVDISDPLMFSKRAYETYGISFDPEDFKANRQIQVTLEAKNILTMEPRQRTSPQVHAVLVSLRQAVPEFSEFPITMQQSLAKVGHYERFTAKRIIIRQGHLADNFYFILSGTAVVTLLETDKVTGEQKARIATTLGRGKSFGELALMHKARRSATVTCRDDVELLSVGREDFVDIFMHVDRGVEPEHIRFLRVLPMLRGWPVHVLPHDNPKILLFTYVRRGVVLCRDSNNSDWIFVIKSGSCRIIKALPNLAPAGKDTSSTSSTTSLSKLTNMTSPNLRSKHTGPLASIEEETATSDEEDSSMYSDEFDSREARLLGRKKESNVFGSNTDEQEDKKMGLQYVQSLDGITYNKNNYGDSEKSLKDDSSNEDSPRNCIFVQVLKLGPKDIFGLESSVFSNMKKTVSTSLVSDGAEMIMINRKFFMENTSSDLRNCMRKEIHPLPTEESLQNQLQNRVEWESYRTLTLQKTMAEMNLIDTHRR